ncbi:hypothetical protein [Desulfopila sp. IMCC35006]|uniref:hypothetical protein n=1 Tax=Desulfopila sp. IMCC35006 TaxID=2569542 RepID=UPI0010ABC9C6|nr:hypothetical protein [Desulfopila sp. IMCC35006]
MKASVRPGGATNAFRVASKLRLQQQKKERSNPALVRVPGLIVENSGFQPVKVACGSVKK